MTKIGRMILYAVIFGLLSPVFGTIIYISMMVLQVNHVDHSLIYTSLSYLMGLGYLFWSIPKLLVIVNGQSAVSSEVRGVMFLIRMCLIGLAVAIIEPLNLSVLIFMSLFGVIIAYLCWGIAAVFTGVITSFIRLPRWQHCAVSGSIGALAAYLTLLIVVRGFIWFPFFISLALCLSLVTVTRWLLRLLLCQIAQISSLSFLSYHLINGVLFTLFVYLQIVICMEYIFQVYDAEINNVSVAQLRFIPILGFFSSFVLTWWLTKRSVKFKKKFQ